MDLFSNLYVADVIKTRSGSEKSFGQSGILKFVKDNVELTNCALCQWCGRWKGPIVLGQSTLKDCESQSKGIFLERDSPGWSLSSGKTSRRIMLNCIPLTFKSVLAESIGSTARHFCGSSPFHNAEVPQWRFPVGFPAQKNFSGQCALLVQSRQQGMGVCEVFAGTDMGFSGWQSRKLFKQGCGRACERKAPEWGHANAGCTE